jgi:hypothetical protein
LYANQVVFNLPFSDTAMHEEQMTSDSAETERQENRIGTSYFAVILAACAIGAIVLWTVRDRVGQAGNSELLLVLVWLFYSFGVAALVLARARGDRLQVQ